MGLTERCGGLEVPRHHALEPTNASPTEHLQLPIRSTRLADKLRQQIAPCSTQHTEFGKFSASQTGSNPDSVVGGQHSSDRVSWQNLNSRQSPPAGQLEPAYQPANPYRESPSQRYNELPAQQRQDGRQPSRIDGQDQGQAQRYRPHGIAELE